jgi:predicted GIY-YIG superfamily endonuclease
VNEQTALYRFLGSEDASLYIGITHDLGERWSSHARKQPWWHEVRRLTVDMYPDREAAQDAETAAIKAERPRHNITHNVDPVTGLPMLLNVVGNGDWRVTGRIGMTDVRTRLTYVVEEVSREDRCVFITTRWTPYAAIVPARLGKAIEAVGGPDAALKLLRATTP